VAGAILLWIVSFVVGFYVLHLVIRSAIDGSETTRLLREIRDRLTKNEQELNDRF